MYSINQNTLKENLSSKDIEKSKSNLNLAYILLTLGGALIALDK